MTLSLRKRHRPSQGREHHACQTNCLIRRQTGYRCYCTTDPGEHRPGQVSYELGLHDESARSVADEGKRIARNQRDRRCVGRRDHPHVIRIDDVHLRHAIVVLAARCDDANVVVEANPFERAEQSVAMRGQRHVAAAVPRQRRVWKMADRLPQRFVVVAFRDRSREFEPGDVDTADDLAGLERLRNVRHAVADGTRRRPLDRNHLLDLRFRGALIAPGADRDDAVENEARDTERDQRAAHPRMPSTAGITDHRSTSSSAPAMIRASRAHGELLAGGSSHVNRHAPKRVATHAARRCRL